MSKTTIIILIVIAIIGWMAYAQVDIDNRQDQEIEELREQIEDRVWYDNGEYGFIKDGIRYNCEPLTQ